MISSPSSSYGQAFVSAHADALDAAADLKAITAFRTDPPAFLLISAKRKK